MEDVTILSSRRAYEFPADGIRLTLLSSHAVLQLIRRAFSFEVATVGTPVATFGPVPGTMPPGLVFSYGIVPLSDAEAVPVRFVHVEPRRIVVDVAGPSSAIDPTFRRLKDQIADLRTFDGKPALEQPTGTRDYSELTVRMPFGLEQLLPSALREPISGAFGIPDQDAERLVFSLLVQPLPAGQEFPGSVLRDYRSLTLEPRVGTPPDDRVLFSGAPLDSQTHLALLKQVEAAVTSHS